MSSTFQHLQHTSARSWAIPTFLCPFLISSRISLVRLPFRSLSKCARASPHRCLHLDTNQGLHEVPIRLENASGLPWNCPGCGAYSQTSKAEEAGYYSSSRKAVKNILARRNGILETRHEEELAIFDQALQSLDGKMAAELGLRAEIPAKDIDHSIPICGRCHDLLHHHKGVSIIHPTMESIREFIFESPYKNNHIYHVVDAADFPMSVVPKLHKYLSLMPQRSRNRRAKTERFYHDRKTDMSFIITRSDLLAPSKDQVDRMMPYLVSVLRDVLGESNANIRLGNVRCVSSQRGWWTRQIKEEIWKRGGGGWMVGKVNVGKSSLFEAVFPKGRSQDINFLSLRHAARQDIDESDEIPLTDDLPRPAGIPAPDRTPPSTELEELSASPSEEKFEENVETVDTSTKADVHLKHFLADADMEDQEGTLLPPVPTETAFPVMPTISHVSGTTASPIRLLYGNKRGELVDLPGLSRGILEDMVKEDVKRSLIMRHRIKPKQISIKPGQSMLIGNHLRITPVWPEDAVFLAYPFLTIEGHVCYTAKAAEFQTQVRHSPVADTLRPGIGASIASAGTFDLATDVTRQQAGPLTSDMAVGLDANVLPFRIFSTDILIEGCGWIELVVQVRRRALEQAERDSVAGFRFPAVEVFSPYGKGVGARRPMGAWILAGLNQKPTTTRPRRSMKGVKKEMKRLGRERERTKEA